MWAFNTQATSADPARSMIKRRPARSRVQYGRARFTDDIPRFASDNRPKPQKKYFHCGESTMRTSGRLMITGDHMYPNHQTQNASRAASSNSEEPRGIRLGSRTAGSFSGSHSSRK